MMKNLFIDCTGTFRSRHTTGIQRTVENIVRRKQIFKDHGFSDVISVVQIGCGYYSFSLKEKNKHSMTKLFICFVKLCRNFLDIFFYNKSVIAPLLKSDDSNDVKNEKSAYAGFILQIRKNILPGLLKITNRIDQLIFRKRKVQFCASDVLFLPDSFWYPDFSICAVKKAHRAGTSIVPLIHDIIPKTHPHVVRVNHSQRFIDSLDKLSFLIDAYICNSKFTLSETKKVFQQEHKNIPSTYFYLGSDFVFSPPIKGQALHDGSYLMVGTIEPRKNHLFVLEAFRSLWDSGNDVELVIVGRIGWSCERVISTIKQSKYLNSKLFYYSDASDEDLKSLYHGCKTVIIASEIEGFGLPLVEAMYFNKMVLASDIPIFKEVGEKYPYYFDLNDNKSLIELIEKNESGSLPYRNAVPTTCSWDESVSSLANKLFHMIYGK